MSTQNVEFPQSFVVRTTVGSKIYFLKDLNCSSYRLSHIEFMIVAAIAQGHLGDCEWTANASKTQKHI